MRTLDWVALGSFYAVLVGIGVWSYHKIKRSSDFYVAGGKLPWWLSGVSHHVSGYSGVVFTGYAAIAYTLGFTLYSWWAVNAALCCMLGAFTIAPRWSRLRQNLDVQSPTEYLKTRYDVPTQQLIAWSGVLLKLLDVAAKYAAIGLILHGFTGLPISTGILVSGAVAMTYVTVGGLWADTANDFFQFCVQVAAGIVMFAVVWSKLAERGLNYATMWQALPAGQTAVFRDPYTLWFALPFVLVVFLSYNGGTWNLAARYLASPTGRTARKASLLSGVLYVLWPLVMFAPLWAAPLLIPNLDDKAAKGVYSMMATQYLPAGLVGLVLASMFAATLSMVASDSNAISSVVARDILPVLRPSSRRADGSTPLAFARLATFAFTLLTLVIALNNERFGGILGLILKWFGGLVGPASIPMVFGLLPVFRACGPRTAWAAILAGFGAFAYVNFGMADAPLALSIGAPVTTSLVIFLLSALVSRNDEVPPEVTELMDALSRDADGEPALEPPTPLTA